MNTPDLHAGNRSRKSRFATLLATGTLTAMALMLGACDKSSDPDDAGNDPLRAQLIAEGQVLFQECAGCHGEGGQNGSAPPLRYSSFIAGDPTRVSRILLLGLPNDIDTASTITVNGIEYQNSMFAIGTSNGWTPREMAAIATYVRAVLNDSTSTNCTVTEVDDMPVSNCTIVPSPASVTATVRPEEIAALRDSLITEGILVE